MSKKITTNSILLGLLIAFSSLSSLPVSAQQINATAREERSVDKGANQGAVRREVKAAVENKAIIAALRMFNIQDTPDVKSKVPRLTEMFFNRIVVKWEPSDGSVISASATITLDSAEFRKILANEGIGAGDGAVSGAKILVSIDEFLGMATVNQRGAAEEKTITYSHDKSTFSDTSGKASGSTSASSASYEKNDVAAYSKDSVAVSGKQSSAYAGRQDTAVAGRSSSAAAAQGYGGSAAAASSSQYAGAQSTQVAGAQSSQYAGAASSQRGYSDKSVSANSSSNSASFNVEQNNVQQRNDKVSYTETVKMPSFANAKPLTGNEALLTARIEAEFQKYGLTVVGERDLRSEGGRKLPVFEIINNGRFDQFVDKIRDKNLQADVWAYGTANYTLDNLGGGAVRCNGTLDVQGVFLTNNDKLASDAIKVDARGSNDQDCRETLALAMATKLAQTLGQSAIEKLNSKSARGGVIDLFIYSRESLGLLKNRALLNALEKNGVKRVSEVSSKDGYVSVKVQVSDGTLIDKLADVAGSIDWLSRADVRDRGNQVCLGVGGPSDCPATFGK